jgi:hypothetical protein
MCNEADEDELTLGQICEIASDIRDGKADPEQARRLLRHFLDCTERGRPDQKVLPDPLLEFFRYVFTVYLKNPRPGNLERLLGLTPGRGKPANPKTAENYHMIAWEVLRRRLEGKLFSDAVLDASEKFRIHERNVQDIWGDHKHVALGLEAVCRGLEASDKKAWWTNEEKIRLRKMYADNAQRWIGLDTSADDRPSETQDIDEHQWEEKDLPEPESDPVPESEPPRGATERDEDPPRDETAPVVEDIPP